jgi:hypothetical protein
MTNERTNLIYITTAILENGGRYRFFAYNSGTVIDTGMKFGTDVCRVVQLISSCYAIRFQDGGRSKMAPVKMP